MTLSIPSSPTFSPQPILSQVRYSSPIAEMPAPVKACVNLQSNPDKIPESVPLQATNVNSNRNQMSVPPARLASTTRLDFWNDPRPTNENPNFVRDYFQASRLHFIGSFRARYESMMVTVGENLGVNPGVLLQNSQNVSQQASKCSPNERVILHVDMDAFFASVAVRDDPSLKGLPVAVCHTAGEISSCTYAAREFGVRAGMFLRDARKLCPNLRNVEYDFPAYERASIQIYSLFFNIPNICVQAVSVDEAYLDLTLLEHSSGSSIETIVSDLRNSIYERTKCTASAGIGPSKLIARLATKAAKPNGQRRILPSQISGYMNTLSVRDLPGIGWRNAKKLADLNVSTVPQLRALSVQTLQERFGSKLGTDFHDLARGVDRTKTEPLRPRKSIGAELSWGVRFRNTEADKLSKFIAEVCEEVALRVTAAGAHGTKVTYKVYRRIPDRSMKGYKHLGHGPCTIVTRSAKLSSPAVGTNLAVALRDTCLKVHTSLKMQPDLFRGVGIQVVDLTFANLKFDHTSLIDPKTRSIASFFKSGSSLGRERKPSRIPEDDNERSNDQENKNVTLEATQEEDRIEPVLAPKSSKPDEGTQEEDRIEPVLAPKSTKPDGGTQEEDRIEPVLAPKSNKSNARSPVTGRDIRGTGGERSRNDEAEISCIGGPQSQCVEMANIGDEIEVGVVRERQEDETDVTMVGNVNLKTAAERDIDLTIPEGWDRRVFQELPRDLQDELLQDCRSRDITGLNIRNTNQVGRRAGTSGASVSGVGLQDAGRNRGRGRGDGLFHGRGVGRGVRRGGVRSGVDRRTKRRKPAQITMTQCAKISRLRKVGTEVLNAEEFRERPLKECVELLEDLKGRPGLAGGGRGISSGVGALKNNPDDSNDGIVGERDIPSPPSLSSDSDVQSDLEEVLERYAREETVIYAQEEIWEYASELMKWLEFTASEIRSAHVELLRGRLLEMLQREQLQRLGEELRVLANFVQKEPCLPWIPWYEKITEEVQTECLRLFQFQLSIPKVER